MGSIFVIILYFNINSEKNPLIASNTSRRMTRGNDRKSKSIVIGLLENDEPCHVLEVIMARHHGEEIRSRSTIRDIKVSGILWSGR